MALVVIPAVPAAAPAQAGTEGGAGLDAVEEAADRGDVEQARRALEAHGDELPPSASERARLDYLVGRLSEDPDSAEVAYLRAAIDGDGPYSAKARLRLAQLHLARGDHDRAADHLARLRADHPGGELVAASWVWTARAAEAADETVRACAAWTRALDAPVPDRAARAEARQGRSRCEASAREPGEVETFTVQLGAFGTEDAALRHRDGAAGIGAAVRVERPSGGVHVYRVRSGRFGSREDADRLAERFREHGFEAVVVPEAP